MKKNITINLFGTLYSIDEDAYELLQKYQDNMRRYYSRKEGGEEIADDVEHRVAELFAELRHQGVEAITIEHVEEIIHRIGDPQEMDATEEEKVKQDMNTTPHKEKPVRRLFRDPEDKMVGGVLSGICQYFGYTDPLPWRIIFVLLCIFTYSGLAFIYLVGWLLIPEAITAEEKLQMRGEPVTPQSLNEEIMRGVNSAKNYVRNPENQSKARGCLGTLLKMIVFCIGAFFVLVFGGVLVGLLVALIGTLFAMIFGVGFLATNDIIVDPQFLEFIQVFPHWLIWVFAASSILVIAIPLILVIRLMFRKSNAPSMSTSSRIGILLTWLIALAISIVCLAFAGKTIENINVDFRHKRELVDTTKNTRNGLYLTGESWDFLDDNGWNLVEYENGNKKLVDKGNDPRTNEYTKYFLLEGTRGKSSSLKYRIEQMTNIKPGHYRIEAMVYANGQGNAVYAILPGKTQKTITTDIAPYALSNITDINWDMAKQCSFFQSAKDEEAWKNVQKRAEERKWDYICMDFDIENEGLLKYGITNSIDFNSAPWTSTKVKVSNLKLTKTYHTISQ